MLDAIRHAIPKPAKQALKFALVDPLRDRRRRSRLKRVINRVLAGELGIELLGEARSAWGNEGFSADLTYVTAAAELAKTAQGPILECGSGLTTLVCGAIAQRRGIPMHCLEQDSAWADEVKRLLFGLRAQVWHTPLVLKDDHAWYDITNVELPKHIGAVICDGPAIPTDWSPAVRINWRYGVLPALAAAGIAYDRLLLDDADDPRAPGVLERWSQNFGATHRLIKADDGVCAMVAAPATDARSSPAH